MATKDYRGILLRKIANMLIMEKADKPGLCSGKTGYAVFFYHYFKYTGNPLYEREADTLIDEALGNLSAKLPHNIQEGLPGIAVGVGHLISRGIVETDNDADRLFSGIDAEILDTRFSPSDMPAADSYPFFHKGYFVWSRTAGSPMTTHKLLLVARSLDDLEAAFARPGTVGYSYFMYAASALSYLDYLIGRNIMRERAGAIYDVILAKLDTLAATKGVSAAEVEALGLAGARSAAGNSRRLRTFLGRLGKYPVRQPQSSGDNGPGDPLPDYWTKVIFSRFGHKSGELKQLSVLMQDPWGKAYNDPYFLLGLGLWLLRVDLFGKNNPV